MGPPTRYSVGDQGAGKVLTDSHKREFAGIAPQDNKASGGPPSGGQTPWPYVDVVLPRAATLGDVTGDVGSTLSALDPTGAPPAPPHRQSLQPPALPGSSAKAWEQSGAGQTTPAISYAGQYKLKPFF